MGKKRNNPSKSQRQARKASRVHQAAAETGVRIEQAIRNIEGLDPRSRAIALLTLNAIENVREIAAEPLTASPSDQPAPLKNEPTTFSGTVEAAGQDYCQSQPLNEAVVPEPAAPQQPIPLVAPDEDVADYELGYSDDEAAVPVPEQLPAPRSLFERIAPNSLFHRIRKRKRHGGASRRH